MSAMLTFRNGDRRYAVNPKLVCYVCRSAAGRTWIFFSGNGQDFIEVDEDFDEVHSKIADLN